MQEDLVADVVDETWDPAPTKVLVVSATELVWGAQNSLLTVLPALARRGIDVTLASRGDGELSRRWRALGLPIVEVPLQQEWTYRSFCKATGVRSKHYALGRAAQDCMSGASNVAEVASGYDVLHSYSMSAHLTVALAGKLTDVPVALDVHETIGTRGGRGICAVALRMSAVGICVSERVAGLIRLGTAGRTVVVGRATDPDRFFPGPADMVVRRALCQRPEDWIVSVIGQVIPCKEVEVAIEAVAALPVLAGRSVQLAIVGDFQDVEPDWSDGLRRMAWARLGPRARFVPKREDIEEVLRSSDVVVSAARGEAFGRSVLEAQACGVPTIGVRGSGTEEMISDWETGLLFSPGSASELARCIEIFCGDDALRATVTRRARDAATVRFSAEAVGSRTAAVYEDMVRAHRPRHRGPDRVGVPRRIVRRLAETERGRGKSDAGGAWTA